MRKKLTVYLLPAIVFCLMGSTITAQPNVLPPNQPEQDACNALSLCGAKFYTPFSYQGNGRVTDLNETPCFGGGDAEFNSMWMKVRVSTSGTMVFSIIPRNPIDDYDFAVLKVTGNACGNLSKDNVVRCNFNVNITGSNPGGIVGLNMSSDIESVPAGAFGESFCKHIDAVAGETYFILINNYGDDNNPGPSNGFTIDFTGSTATFDQTPPPAFGSIDTSVCYNAKSVTLHLTNPVLCDSIATDGSDFFIAPFAGISKAAGVNCYGFGGYTNTVTITFASTPAPGTYTLSAKKGTDGNTLIGLCNSPLQLPTGIRFRVLAPVTAVDSQFTCYKDLPYLWNGVRVNRGGSNAATFTTTSAGGCDSTVTLNLTVSPAPVTTSAAKTICAGQVYNLPWDGTAVNTAGVYTHTYNNMAGCDSVEATITLTVDSPSRNIQALICSGLPKVLAIGTGFDNYVWSNGATTPAITINQAGTYTVQATDGVGCVASDTFNISTDPIAVILAKNIPLCQGTTLPIDAGAGFASYLWNDGSKQQTISISNPGQYWVTVTDADNCSAADTTAVIAVALPAGFLPAAITKCFFNTVTIKPSTSFNKYLWSTGETTPAINVLVGGAYTLQVTDANGCVGTASTTIMDSACAEYLYMPTAFTPNGDSHNDVFRPVFAGVAVRYSFIVYNRWGLKVFESGDPANGWDGNVGGKPQPPGVYVWICQYQLTRRQPVSLKGTVVLVR